MERTCKKCGETKPINEFGKHNNCKEGHIYTCKKCNSEYHKEWGKSNKKHLIEYKREHSESVKEWKRRYRSRNKEKINKCSRRYWNLHRINIDEVYIVRMIKHNSGISAELTYQNPELIENYREQAKLKRQLKQLQNESTTNS